MKRITIKKEIRDADGKENTVYIVSALTFKQKDNTIKQQIPHPLGTDIMEFSSLDEAKKAIEMSGFLYILPNGEIQTESKPRAVQSIDLQEKIFQSLLKMAKDSNSSVQASAIYALGELKDRKLLPIFADKMGEDNDAVRTNAINALVNFGAGAANTAIKALEDENWVRRKSAITVIERLANETALKPEIFFEPLIERFNDSNNIVKCSAITAVGKIFKVYRENN